MSLLFPILLYFSYSKIQAPSLLDLCASGSVSSQCQNLNQEYTSTSELTSTYFSFVMNANIVFQSCKFTGFTSTNSDVSIISITQAQEGTLFKMDDCTFSQNTLVSPLLTFEGSSVEISKTTFTDNQFSGNLFSLSNSNGLIKNCSFISNRLGSAMALTKKEAKSSYSIISLTSNSIAVFTGCCFFVPEDAAIAIQTTENSKIEFSNQPSVFNCAMEYAFSQQDATISDNVHVYYSQTQCQINPHDGDDDKDDDDDSDDDKDDKITKYLYIGIGSAAGIIIIAIIILICLRFHGKCKKLEQHSEELNDIEEKRQAYLLQENEGGVEGNEL